jgi:hypothetical protein
VVRACCLLSIATAALTIAATSTLAQPVDSSGTYRQNPAVLSRYPDIPIALAAPALAPGYTGFTSQPDLEKFLADIAARADDRARLGELGRSREGRAIPYLIFAKGVSDAAAAARAGRPIIWFIGQQHGNEPAGAEALLAVAAALADGELAPLLAHLVVIVAPRLNPDGAAAHRRGVAGGQDMNRDHLLLALPETRALHARMGDWPPDIVVDFHEFTVAHRWLEKFAALQATDAMLQAATHPMVEKDVRKLGDGLFIGAVEQALARNGLASTVYHTTSNDRADRAVSTGGNAAGIARNAFGLAGAVSLLIETRGVGVGRDALQRRIATHYLAAKTVLETAAADRQRLLEALAAAREAAGKERESLIVSHRLPVVPMQLRLVDPASGEPRQVDVGLRDARNATPETIRARPAGYLLDPPARSLLRLLAAKRIGHCLLAGEQQIDVESYRLERRADAADAEAESINPRQALAATVESRKVLAPAGAVFVPLSQPGAALAAAMLEPDGPGGPLAAGTAPLADADGLAPIHRVPAGKRPRLAPPSPDQAKLCAN